MSDTVKVIIEIPKDIYARCKEYKLWSYDAETLEGAVAQGTPLDDVKAELERANRMYPYTNHGILEAIAIIDKHIDNAESSVPEKGKWIPVSSVEEIPEAAIWVTHKGADYAYVEVLGWDSQRNCRTEDGGFRCDSDLKDVVAYMPYSEPEPYKAESKEYRYANINNPKDLTFMFDGVTAVTDELIEQMRQGK